jgi:short-subunit dehydrogenase
MNLLDKTALISGASDGIGKSIALQLAKQKAGLILFGRDETKLGGVARQCEDEGVKVSTYAFDITDSTKCDQVVNEVLQTHSVDALINCAGIWHLA